jgi:alkylhydroperoxidase/carboxymuconolactone decarboxylase family protein YurZ
MKKGPEFLNILEEKDAEFTRHIKANLEKEHEDSALPAKIKLLMILALDAAHGEHEGVKIVAKRAREAGATEEEILETVKVVGNTCGIQGLYVAMNAFQK